MDAGGDQDAPDERYYPVTLPTSNAAGGVLDRRVQSEDAPPTGAKSRADVRGRSVVS
jgi:hypothetical protein